MKLSDVIADMILDMFDDETPTVQIQRNDLAAQLGCVPSQINYVISSRFTPEQGFYTESRRGGGGYILISRASNTENPMLSIINSIGDSLDEKTARSSVYNLVYHDVISERAGQLILSVVADSNFRGVSPDVRNRIRANQFKQMLIVLGSK